MGYGTYEATHVKIIESGTRLFLENGYERTNLRELCKEAGVTTGSFYRHFQSKEDLFSFLVKPVVDEMTAMFGNSETDGENLIREIKLEEFWQFNEDTAEAFVRYIYDHYVSFKLLLQCADGTPYSSFVTDLTEMEVQSSIQIFNAMRGQGLKIPDFSEKELHMLSHAYVSSVLECVMHDYEINETLKYTKTVVAFFSAGWKKILGL